MKHSTYSFQQTYELLQDLDPDGVASDIYENTIEFAKEFIAPFDRTMSDTHTFHEPLWRQMGKHGLSGLRMPVEYGGQGLGWLPYIAAVSAIAAHSGSTALSFVANTNLLMERIEEHATPEKKQKYLPGLISGELVGSLAMSEPGAGSDVMAMRSKIAGNVLSGDKQWITNAPRSNVFVVYAKSDPANPRALTAIIVDRDTPGFSVGKKWIKDSMKGSETAPIYFDDCPIEPDNILHTIHNGETVLKDGLPPERLSISTIGHGISCAAINSFRAYTKNRVQFGKTLDRFQGVAFPAADCVTQLFGLQNSLFMTAAMLDRKPNSMTASKASKVFLLASQAADEITAADRDALGGMGLVAESNAILRHNDASLTRTGAGSRNVQKIIVAKDFYNF